MAQMSPDSLIISSARHVIQVLLAHHYIDKRSTGDACNFKVAEGNLRYQQNEIPGEMGGLLEEGGIVDCILITCLRIADSFERHARELSLLRNRGLCL